jgi:catechol 2,3-dioxygenase-like lactoylglutathione lyase family enzyme
LEFYRDVLGLEGTVHPEGYGFTLNFPNGSNVVLLRGEPPSSMGDFHFGVALATPEAVRQMRETLRARGATETEWVDVPGYASVKVTDPDGYSVQVVWDPVQHVDG